MHCEFGLGGPSPTPHPGISDLPLSVHKASGMPHGPVLAVVGVLHSTPWPGVLAVAQILAVKIDRQKAAILAVGGGGAADLERAVRLDDDRIRPKSDVGVG